MSTISIHKSAGVGISDAMLPPLNLLPTIIDGPGDYLTRNRWRVTIHEVTPLESAQTTAFRAKGSFWKSPKTLGANPRYSIWHVSGRYSVFNGSQFDIVARWPA